MSKITERSFKQFLTNKNGSMDTYGIHDNTWITDNSICLELSVNNKWKHNKTANKQKTKEIKEIINSVSNNLYPIGDCSEIKELQTGITTSVWHQMSLYLNIKYVNFIKTLGLSLYVDQNKVKLTQLILTGQTDNRDYYNTPVAIRDKDGKLVGIVLGIRPW